MKAGGDIFATMMAVVGMMMTTVIMSVMILIIRIIRSNTAWGTV